jgi:transposase-like protein
VGPPLPRNHQTVGVRMAGIRPIPAVRHPHSHRDLHDECINARIRKAVNARGHRTTETAALKCVYLAIMSLDPTGRGRQRWSNRWKEALNAFEITFDGRLAAGRK